MRKTALALVGAFALLAAACSSSPAATEPGGPLEPNPSVAEPSVAAPDGVVEAHSGPVEEVTVDGIVDHLEALQTIADEHGGTRVSGSPGYDASVRYVADVLRATGYEVGLISTEVPVFELEGPTVFERTSPDPREWVDGVDLRSMLFSPSGDVRGRVAFAGTGCSISEFDGFPAGDVALVTPGDCFRRDQVRLAQGAHASAVIGVGRTGTGAPLRPTLIYPEGLSIPAISVTSDLGAEIEEGWVVHIRVRASTHYEDVESVIADLPGRGDAVMLGGHLDSALDGPGLNDNGSGTALLLETARWLASAQPETAVRFAFWAGEEEGLWGSWEYAHALTAEERDAIEIYINMDMIASPNFVTFVYEADPGEAVSDLVERLFVEALDDAGAASELLNLHGASDHAAFADVGVATGGLYSGSQEIKTDEQARDYGGTAGEPLDPCYHQPCDTIGNLSRTAISIHAAGFVAVLTALLLT